MVSSSVSSFWEAAWAAGFCGSHRVLLQVIHNSGERYVIQFSQSAGETDIDDSRSDVFRSPPRTITLNVALNESASLAE
jgi:hypothetical protein